MILVLIWKILKFATKVLDSDFRFFHSVARPLIVNRAFMSWTLMWRNFWVFYYSSTEHPKSSLTRYEKKVGSELRLILGNSGMKRKEATWHCLEQKRLKRIILTPSPFLSFPSEPRCLKITEKVSFNIASEASYVYILSGQNLIKKAQNGPFWRVFENLKLAVKQCYQTGQF